MTQETVADLERNKMELSQVLQRKEKELGSLSGKIEDEQTLGNKLNQQIKELQSRQGNYEILVSVGIIYNTFYRLWCG